MWAGVDARDRMAGATALVRATVLVLLLVFPPLAAEGRGRGGGGGPPAPTIGKVTPAQGPVGGGTPVTLSGNNFPPGSRVTFGGVEAKDVVVVNRKCITAVTPPHAAGRVSVTVGSGIRGLAFTYEEEHSP
ncbi:MAG TPA: IPT/TIG domain-containing protein [Anaeromyxobacteraceae bacterium]|nr:IPT/TIG domain-containing protein [Anaeromyxobacteraceae bacterium]